MIGYELFYAVCRTKADSRPSPIKKAAPSRLLAIEIHGF